MKSIFRNLVISMGLTILITPAVYGEYQPAPGTLPATKPPAEEKRGKIERHSPGPNPYLNPDLDSMLDPALNSGLDREIVSGSRDEADLLNQETVGGGVFFDSGGDIMRYGSDIGLGNAAFRRSDGFELVRDAREGVDERRIVTRSGERVAL